jgi:hypothetical protein
MGLMKPNPRGAGLLGASILVALSGCSSPPPPPQSLPSSVIAPVATIQDLMQSEVDASADEIWDAVETTSDQSGEHDKQPHTGEEWAAVRREVIVLIEAGNLLTVDGRRISAAPFAAEAAGALDSAGIERRIAGNRAAFNQFAVTLRETGRKMLEAVDAHDAKALVNSGGVLDEVCESCHLTFWYPKQVIPPWPKQGDARYGHIQTNPSGK